MNDNVVDAEVVVERQGDDTVEPTGAGREAIEDAEVVGDAPLRLANRS